MTALFTLPKQRLFDLNGALIPGGKVYFYDAGTTDERTVYQDSVFTTAHTQPVVADAEAYLAPIYPRASDGAYKIVVTDADDVTIYTVDNIPGPTDTSGFLTGTVATTSPVLSRSAAFSVVSSMGGKIIDADPTGGTFRVTLDSAITLGDGFEVTIRHAGTANRVRIVTTGGQTMGSRSIITLSYPGESVKLIANGANWTIGASSQALHALGTAPPRFIIQDRLTAPPTSPFTGARYIITGTPTGDWASYSEHDIVEFDGGGNWIQITPLQGWDAYVVDEKRSYQFDNTEWVEWSNVEAPAASTIEHIVLRHELTSGTDGGEVTTGAWTAYAHNTTVENTITGATVASGGASVTLPTGTYLVRGWRSLAAVDAARAQLISTTDSTKFLDSDSAYFQHASATGENTSVAGRAEYAGILSVTAATETFEAQYYAEDKSGVLANTLGFPTSITDLPEVYAYLEIIDMESLRGPQGQQGAQGTDGLDAAYPYQWETTTSGDPGSGKIAVNNASMASVTELRVSDDTLHGADLSAVIATWDRSTSTNKARIRISGEVDPSDYLELTLTGSVIDNTTYYSMPVAYVGHNGSFTAADNLAMLVVESGERGATGTSGGTGPVVLATENGAAGDGATNDGPTLQSLIDAMDDGDVLVLDEGRTYVTNQALTIPDKKHIKFDGATLKLGASASYVLQFEDDGTFQSITGPGIIDANGNTTASAVFGKGTKDACIDGIEIKNWSGRAINLASNMTSSEPCERPKILNCYVHTPGANAGFPILFNSGIGGPRIIEPFVGNTVVIGTDPNSPTYGAYSAANNRTGDQITFQGCERPRCIGVTSLYGGENGITFARLCSDGIIKDCIVKYNDAHGINVGSGYSKLTLDSDAAAAGFTVSANAVTGGTSGASGTSISAIDGNDIYIEGTTFPTGAWEIGETVTQATTGGSAAISAVELNERCVVANNICTDNGIDDDQDQGQILSGVYFQLAIDCMAVGNVTGNPEQAGYLNAPSAIPVQEQNYGIYIASSKVGVANNVDVGAAFGRTNQNGIQTLAGAYAEYLFQDLSDGDKGDITVSSSGTVWTIDSGAVTASKMAANSVGNTAIVDGVVGTSKLADAAVTQAKIADGAVSTAKIADDAVQYAKLQNLNQYEVIGRVAAGSGNATGLDGTDLATFIDAATTSLPGVMSASDKTKLDGIEAGATADQSNAEIETAYNAQVSIVSQAEAEAGTATTVRRWTAQRVAQAIAALGGSGSGDVVGPASATDNALVRFDSTTGKLVQNSSVTLDDSQIMNGLLRLGVNVTTPHADTTIHLKSSAANKKPIRVDGFTSGSLLFVVNETASGDGTFNLYTSAVGVGVFLNSSGASYFANGGLGVGTSTVNAQLDVAGDIAITDGMAAPSAVSGKARIFVDLDDGDLKVIFGDGTTKTIVTDT